MAIEQKPMKQNQSIRQGRWTKEEHYRFLEALKLYGKEWKKVQEHVKTRTSTQARSHAQKFFQKLEKKKQNLQDFLENLDVNNLDKHCIMSDLEDEEPSS
jgi:SHAQKYF class myb-like DNA-binding protein